MSEGPKFYTSWDTVVFFFVTVVGLFFSLQRVIYPKQQAVASISPAVTFASANKVIDLGCIDENPVFSPIPNLDGKIRFKGRLCGGANKLGLKNVTVKNVTQSVEATVFQSVRDHFSTDNLQVQHGKNLIEVHWQNTPDKIGTLQVEVFRK